MGTRVEFIAALFVVATLGGCAPVVTAPTSSAPTRSASPAPTTSATPTPTPSVGPVAARVEIDGDSVSVKTAEGAVLVDVPFSTDAVAASSQLGAAIGGSATVTTSAGNETCAAETTHYAWGGLELHAPGGYETAPGATFVATAKGPATANGLAVLMPNGLGVGAATAAVLSAQPGVPAEGDTGGDSVVYYDVKSGHPLGDMDTFYGAAAFAHGGIVTSLVSPIFYYYDC